MSGIASGTPEASTERNVDVGPWILPADDADGGASTGSGTTRSAAHFRQWTTDPTFDCETPRSWLHR
ncbi:MAG TPA: hypothetical protein VKP69_04525 [Isosphaeraceae bacterium]|nr:hypothetical protein [Isosphaeraceae bacterium]